MDAGDEDTKEERPQPDWDSFETWQGEEAGEDPWWARIFHWLMVGVVLAIVFAVAGGLAFLLPYGSRARGLIADETAAAAGIRFVIGGVVGVGAVLGIYLGKR